MGNLRSPVLLAEAIAIVALTAFFASTWELGFLKQGVVIVLIGLAVVLLWLLHSFLLKRFVSTWISLTVFVVAYALGSYFGLNSFNVLVEYWSHEAMQSLHAIQLALERYAEDNEGHYPPFLIGGDMYSGHSIDPLLGEGRWETYPRCAGMYHGYPVSEGSYALLRSLVPWAINPNYYCSLPSDLKRLQAEFDDPYGAGNKTNRFGSDYTRMGNVAADHRFPQASFGYPFWERETTFDNRMALALQGQFYYKALYSPGSDQPDGYILMAFGRADYDWGDWLTTESGGHELDCRLPDGGGVGMAVPVLRQLGLKPDGIPDGVIIVLAGGWVMSDM